MDQLPLETPRSTSLYRFFDRAGLLLYVGITCQGPKRYKAHAKTQPWWPEVALSSVEHFETRKEAEEAERVAIAFEHPRHNKVNPLGSQPVEMSESGLRTLHASEDFIKRVEGIIDELSGLLTDVDAIDGLTERGSECSVEALEALRALVDAEKAWQFDVGPRVS